MKIKWGALVVDGRGKIGGQVASKNRSGAYMRNKVTPTNPQTAAQSAVRAILAAASQAWSGLTEAQRAAWNGAVQAWIGNNVFADGVVPSGKNLYTRLRANLVGIGQAALSTPPLPVAVVAPGLGTIDCDISDTELNVPYTGTSAAQYLIIEATAPQTAGTYNPSGRYRQIHTALQNTASPINVYTQYVAKFGAPAAGQKVFVRVKSIVTATGQNSPYESGSCIVQA